MFDPDAPLDLDQLRTRLRAMSDQALKHWGASAAESSRNPGVQSLTY
jgi:hypothetical protein